MVRMYCVVLFVLGVSAWSGAAHGAVVDDAPEAADYELVYELEIPDVAAFNASGVPYGQDLSQEIDFTFDRVAYHLELQKAGQDRVFVYVSMPSLVMSAQQTGVPHAGTGVALQQVVEGLHVVSNHPELAGLSDLDTGAIEFWPSNYITSNAAQIPGASPDVYDFGDASTGGAGYGSMQLHDYASGQTLFAYNAWGPGGSPSDLGIGNNPDAGTLGHPDWTFTQSAATYTLKTLRVLVRPGPLPQGLSLTVQSPDPHEVVQRRPGNTGTLEVAGQIVLGCDTIEGRLVPLDLEGDPSGEPTAWTVIEEAPSGGSFVGALEAEAGWYRLELEVHLGGEPIDTVTIEPVGIGEVFITAGQSNSANHGESPMTPEDPRVSAWGTAGWQHAVDPQPIATGSSGSPWPALGDLLADRFDVPIGLISVGWGGTSVDQWRPYATDQLYTRLLLALDEVGHEGARAILWHQGESDAAKGVSAVDYANQLQEVIDATRKDAGWPVPWGVARAAYLPGIDQAILDAIIGGQQQVIDQDELTFEGPTTEDLLGPAWRYDNVHFNVAGLVEHAKRWDAVIELPPCQGFVEDETCDEPEPEPEPEPAPEPQPEPTPDAGTGEDTSPEQDAGPVAETTPCPCDTSTEETPSTSSGSDESSGCQSGPGDARLGLWMTVCLLWLGALRRRRASPRAS